MSSCPCCDCILKYFRKGAAKKKLKGDIEEQAFINQTPEEALNETIKPPPHPSDNYKNKTTKKAQPQYEEEEGALKEERIESDLLDVKMELTPTPNQIPATKIQTKNIEDLMEEELNLTSHQAVVQHAQKKEEEKIVEDLIPLQENPVQEKFVINLDPIDPFFRILHEKTAKIAEQLSMKGVPADISEPNKSHLSISLADSSSRMTTFLATYRLQCNYSYYQSLLKNDKTISSLSPLIAEAKVIQTLRANLTRNTLKFKRLGSFQARDIFYVKYQNSSKRQYWQVYIQDQKAELTPHYKTCEIYCVKNIKEDPKELFITEYIEIDLQSSNASSIVPKLVQQYRNYLNNLATHLEHNYEQETA